MPHPAEELDSPLMSFGDHLDELRRRLVLALLAPIPIFVVCLIYGSPLLTFLARPLLDQLRAAGESPTLLATSPLEAFNTYLKVATIITIILSMPWILYQAWLFIAPGLYASERRFVYFLLPLSGALTALGMVFLYKVVLPISLFFLILFGSSLIGEGTRPAIAIPQGVTLPAAPVLKGDPDLKALPPGSMWINEDLRQLRFRLDDEKSIVGVPLIRGGGGGIAQQYRIGEYINLVFALAIVFSICFQVPVVLMLLSWVGALVPKDLTPYRRHILFGCVVVSALFPSQDPWTLLLLSGAMYGLFEFGLALMRFVPPGRVQAGLPVMERLRRMRQERRSNPGPGHRSHGADRADDS